MIIILAQEFPLWPLMEPFSIYYGGKNSFKVAKFFPSTRLPPSLSLFNRT
jgi:hypothetical protein